MYLNFFQGTDGAFRESFIYDGIYQRTIPIEFQEIALTAHAVIALSNFMQEVIKLPSNIAYIVQRGDY